MVGDRKGLGGHVAASTHLSVYLTSIEWVLLGPGADGNRIPKPIRGSWSGMIRKCMWRVGR